MAAQPVYPDEFHFEMDRLYGRLTDYVDALLGKAMVQMRVDRQESKMRDEMLLKRIETVEATQTTIIDMQRSIVETLTKLTTQQTAIVEQQTAMIAQQAAIVERLDSLQEQMRDGFAAQGERISELAMRVERLERGNHPSNNE